MPRLGNDGVSDLVVFTRAELLTGGTMGKGDIFYQRLAGGAPFGGAVQVTNGVQDNQLDDVSGDFIVYTSYDSTTSMSGRIMLYQISTTLLYGIGSAPVIQEPRIDGNKVVWREGGANATMVMIYDLAWLGTTRRADILAGPTPPTYSLDIGDRFVVWAEQSGGQLDLVAFDIAAGARLPLTATATTNESEPSTSGAWIVWQAQDKGVAASRIVARNVDTAEERVIADWGVYNYRPSISGDLIAWESMRYGNLDIFVHRLSTKETFQVTTSLADQYLNDIFGQSVAYVDERTGTSDIYVSDLSFVSPTIELDVTEAEIELEGKKCSLAEVKVRARLQAAVPGPDDVVALYLDGAPVFAVPFGQFEPEMHHGTAVPGVYELKARHLQVKLDFARGRLAVEAEKVKLTGYDPSNGVDVEVRIGGASAVDNIQPVEDEDEHHRHHRHECRGGHREH